MKTMTKTYQSVPDKIFAWSVKAVAMLVLLLLVSIIISLFIAAWPSIHKFGLSFLWEKRWNPPNDQFGALVPIYGTLVTSFTFSRKVSAMNFARRGSPGINTVFAKSPFSAVLCNVGIRQYLLDNLQ